MKNEIRKLIVENINEDATNASDVADKILSLFNVSGSFSQKDMENFAAKCMIFGNRGKTTTELLREFCDNDL